MIIIGFIYYIEWASMSRRILSNNQAVHAFDLLDYILTRHVENCIQLQLVFFFSSTFLFMCVHFHAVALGMA